MRLALCLLFFLALLSDKLEIDLVLGALLAGAVVRAALLLYRSDLSSNQRNALALHSGTQLPLVVSITSIAVHRGLMPSGQGAALIGVGVLTVILFPALAQSFVGETREYQSV